MKKILYLSFFLIISCTRYDNSPEGVLNSFVDKRFKGETAEVLSDHLTGGLKEEFLKISPEEFDTYNDLSALKKGRLKIVSTRCQGNTCYLTYVVDYKTLENDSATFETQTKKVAEFLKIDGQWKISQLTQIKTFHESLDPINP